jgi:hypothetical protein
MTPLLAAATLLTPFFPPLINWIQGKGGEGLLDKALATASQLTQQTDPQRIALALSQKPELLFEFHKAMVLLEQQGDKVDMQDRQSARLRDMALLRHNTRNIRADIMVIAAACGLGGCLLALALYRGHLPGEAVGIISTVAGIFGSCLKDAYAFEFGSSRGSREKDQHVQLLLK